MQVYQPPHEYMLSIFDVRIPGVAERFNHERGVAGEHGEVEMLDLDHIIIVVKPSASLESL